MKYIARTIFIVFIIAACSTSEVIVEERAEVEPESSLPAWYSPNTISSSNENQFMGYSMAVAVDSSEAILTGKESAIANVKYEIDKFAEEVRLKLTMDQSNDRYSRPDFIIKLRNTVHELNLVDSEFEREFEVREDDITQVYIRITVDRSDIIEHFSERLSDDPFIRALHTDRDEL